jgi:hypothetical protein
VEELDYLPDHEYTEFTDSEGTVWQIDTAFLLSRYMCIYGQGCKGTKGIPHHGCCEVGAIYADDADVAQVQQMVDRMDDEEFSNAKEIRKRHLVTQGKDRKTRVLGKKCIFVNDVDHPRGPGCALHQGAMARGESHLGNKPSICSWVPLRRDLLDDDTYLIVPFENIEWGGGDWEPLDWYCIDDKDAYVADTPLFLRVTDELLDMMDGDLELYGRVYQYLHRRYVQMAKDESPHGDAVQVQIGRRNGDGKRTEVDTNAEGGAGS